MMMNTKQRILGMLTAGLMSLSAVPVIPAQAADTVLKYEFEDGKTSGGKIYTEGWKGNTQEDGTGEDFDMTNFSGTGFSNDAIVDIHDVSIYHSGCESGTKGTKGDFWGNAQGALNVGNTQYYSVPNVHLSNIDIYDSRGNALFLRASGGKNISGLSLYHVHVDGAGGYGIYYSGASGDASYCDVTLDNCAKGAETAHMPAYVIVYCEEAVETVTDEPENAEYDYYDLLGRRITEMTPNSLYIRVLKHN